jgi:hypothetical protein
MTDMSQGSWLWAAKGAGAVFGGTAGLKVATDLGIEEQIGSSEMVLMGSALASLCAWWALGFVLRLLGQYRPAGPDRNETGAGGNES